MRKTVLIEGGSSMSAAAEGRLPLRGLVLPALLRLMVVLLTLVLCSLAAWFVAQEHRQVLAVAVVALVVPLWGIVGFPALVLLALPIASLWTISTQFTISRLLSLAGGVSAAGWFLLRRKPLRSRTFAMLAVMGVVLAVQALFASDHSYARQMLLKYLFGTLLLGLGLLANVRSRHDLNRLALFFLVIGLLDVGLTGYQAITGRALTLHAAGYFENYVYSTDEGTWASGFGLFATKGENGCFLLLLLAMAGAFYAGRVWLPRIASLAGVALCCVALVLTNYRTAIITAIPLLLLCLVLPQGDLRRRGSTASVLVAGLSVTAVALYLYSHWGALSYRFQPELIAHEYEVGRLSEARQGWAMFLASPLFGQGLGVSRWMHNAWIALLAEMGLTGMLAWLLVVVVVGRRYLEAWRKVHEAPMRALLTAFGAWLAAYYVAMWNGGDIFSWTPVAFGLLMPDMVLAVSQEELKGHESQGLGPPGGP